jgi:hypothetical protein
MMTPIAISAIGVVTSPHPADVGDDRRVRLSPTQPSGSSGSARRSDTDGRRTPAARSTYRMQDDHLTIRVNTGTLEFTRDHAGGQPACTASASSSLAATTVKEPS